MDKNTTKRSPNWDQDEKDLLVKLVSEKLDIIENTKLDTNMNKKKKDAWYTVHTIFNLSVPTERTLDQIQTQWRKLKHIERIKRSRDCSSDEPQEEDTLYSRLSKSVESDYNTQGSNLSTNEFTNHLENSELNIVTIKHELDEILESSDENLFYAEHSKNEEIAPSKRINRDEDVETAKRIKVLDLSILQKECEIKYVKTEFEKKIKVIELQMKHMNEEHSLKMEKLQMELVILKNH